MEDLKFHQGLMQYNTHSGTIGQHNPAEKEQVTDVVYQVKLFIILTIGGIIILFGTLYIISELRRKSAEKIRRHDNERERLIDKKDATDVLMSVESTQRENECFL